jgi:hypothetical protein
MGQLHQSNVGGAAERHVTMLSALRRAVLELPGDTDPATRTAAANGGPLPEPTASYVAKVRDHSYRITDGDLEALTTAGLSEDKIFELTVAAAIGAASRSLGAGMRAMRGDG